MENLIITDVDREIISKILTKPKSSDKSVGIIDAIAAKNLILNDFKSNKDITEWEAFVVKGLSDNEGKPIRSVGSKFQYWFNIRIFIPSLREGIIRNSIDNSKNYSFEEVSDWIDRTRKTDGLIRCLRSDKLIPIQIKNSEPHKVKKIQENMKKLR